VYIGTFDPFLKNSTSLTLSVMTGGVMLQGRLTELPTTAETIGPDSEKKKKKEKGMNNKL
jgi:hypothetical protein